MINEILIAIAVLIASIYLIKYYFARKSKMIKNIREILKRDNPLVKIDGKLIDINTLLREKEEKEKALTPTKAGLWKKLKLLFKRNKKEEVNKEDDTNKLKESDTNTSNAVVSS